MMEDDKQGMTNLQTAGFVVCVLAIVCATVTFAMMMMVSSHYNPIDGENWPNYAIMTVLWLAVCSAAAWLAMRLSRKRASRKAWAIAGGFAAAALVLFVFSLFE